MMTHLVFPSETVARSATGWWSKKTGWPPPSLTLQISVRGVLYNDDAELDTETGKVSKEPSKRDGFFIDVIYGDIPAEAQGYIVSPNHPLFVLA